MKVFISHQKKDRDEAIEIANYLKSVNIDVYFDEYDRELQLALLTEDPDRVVKAIKKGVKLSTHMLCIISPNTLTSKWVPFEVGYGYDRTELASLTLKGLKNSELPDYIKTAPVIRDIIEINDFIKKFGSKYLFESKNFSNFRSAKHPLRGIMDTSVAHDFSTLP